MTQPIYPVILCGGSGTRLWPLSRAMYPKQFIRFFEGNNDSLLAATLKRLDTKDGFERPTLLCNNNHRFLLQDELNQNGIAAREILLEPAARNTAPAIAAAALSVSEERPDAILAVMPSDHLLKDAPAFASAVKQAALTAQEGRFVLFGIKPASAHTGYGYIRTGAPLNGAGPGAYAVDAFVEKPDLATANTYVNDGRYYWNSGIFILPVKAFLKELEHLAPDILSAARAALAASKTDLGFRRLDAAAYAQSPNISIDYAVMEKTALAAVLPLSAGWSDVGSWSSLWDVSSHDAQGNSVIGDAMLIDTRNCYVHSNRALVSAIGVEDLIVVDTADAILIAGRERAQDVGKLVARLKQSNRREHEQHVRSYRPWGHYETLSLGPRFQVKLLHVKPGGKLSLQMHHHRSEHWVVVKGTAKVTAGDIEKLVCENESVYISATQWHRLENPGKVPLEIIEVQIGAYLEEDDIVRSEDVYGRSPDETK